MGCSAHFHFYNESSFLIFRVLTKTVLPIFMTFNKDWGVRRAHDSNHGLCSDIHQVKPNNFLD